MNKDENHDFKILASNLGFPMSSCFCFDILENGDEIFNSMLLEISKARSYILFETFVFWNGEIAEKFTDALCAKAKSGVECKVLFDGFGCKKVSKKLIQKLIDCGVELVFYNPITFKSFFSKNGINQRTHRKLLIIDGSIGYIGGVGIADKWQGDARSPNEYRDLHFKFNGPVISDLQRAFFDNWLEYSPNDTKLQNYKYLQVTSDNESTCNLVLSSPAIKHNSLEELIVYGIQNAKESVKIITPYFIPSDLLLSAFKSSIARGVKVELILSADYIDEPIALHSSRFFWHKYLEMGLSIYLYKPTFNHAKMIIIDSYWCSLGSLNMDYRSLKINEEANLNIFSVEIAEKLTQIFANDIKKSSILDKKYLKDLSFKEKLKDWIYSHFANFL